MSYYLVDAIPLTLEFSIEATQKLDLNLVESSFDLMTNPMFSMSKRRNWMIPTPFVLNDAIIIKQKIKPSSKVVEEKPKYNSRFYHKRDSLNINVTDSLR